MAANLSLGQTLVPAGTRSFVIDNIPASSQGFSLRIGRHASWNIAGTLFSILLEYSQDGTTFREWYRCDVPGGPAPISKFGQPVTEWTLLGTWPGDSVGGVRAKRPAASLRITLTVPNSFTIGSLNWLTQ